jgi:hypothetical protein
MLKQILRGEKIWRAAAPFLCLWTLAESTTAQPVSSFAGNAQHTAVYQPAARDLNRIRWSTGAFAHYGAPLITSSNTIVVPVKTASGFQINVLNGGDGTTKYSLATDYILPSHTWIPVYQPALAAGRLYYPGAGGTVYFIDNPDSSGHGVPVQTAKTGTFIAGTWPPIRCPRLWL